MKVDEDLKDIWESKFWKKHFEHYDFFQNNFEWYKQTVQFLVEQMKDCKNILDTGAGSGNLTEALIKNKHIVTAIDNSPDAIEQLQNKIGKSDNLKTVVGDVCSMNFTENSFDGSTSMFLLPFIKNLQGYIEGVHKALKPCGTFSIAGWSPEPDTYEFLTNKLKQELIEKKILPAHQNIWEELLKTSSINAHTVLASNITREEVQKTLIHIGFEDVKNFSGVAYEKYAYFITAKKA